MFETAAIPTAGASQRLLSTGMGVAGQTLLMACAVAIPLLSPAALPRPQAVFAWIESPALPPVRRTAAATPAPAARPVPLQMRDNVLREPRWIPPAVTRLEDPPLPAGLNPSLATEGAERLNSFIGNFATAATAAMPAAPAAVDKAAAPAPAAAPRRFTVGGRFVAGAPIRRVEPLYPEIAIKARISGTVELEAVIGTDGRVHELRALSGSPLLVRAALDAVRQWVYRPYMLNGDPVEMVQPITVTFKLK